MEWWQILLILLSSIVIGVSLGVLSSHLISRFVLKREGKSTVALLSQVMEPLVKKRREAPVLEKPSEYRAPDLAGDTSVKHEAAPVSKRNHTPLFFCFRFFSRFLVTMIVSTRIPESMAIVAPTNGGA